MMAMVKWLGKAEACFGLLRGAARPPCIGPRLYAVPAMVSEAPITSQSTGSKNWFNGDVRVIEFVKRYGS
jgi:hypothetical protein